MDRFTIAVRWQYCLGEDDITGNMHAEEDADEVRAWEGAHGDTCVLAVKRTPRGRWTIETSDTFTIPVSLYSRRFGSPGDALEYLAKRSGLTVTDAACRCDTAGDCD